MSTSRPSLSASVDWQDKTGTVHSPGVGIFTPAVVRGSYVSPSHPLGTLKVLNQIYSVVLPPSTMGMVSQLEITTATGVEYGTPLVQLTTEAAGDRQVSVGDDADRGGDTGLAVVATMDGIFYRRPKPDAPSYVKVGQVVKKGAVMGLIEVMKTFYPLVFEVEEGLDEAKVEKVLVDDGGEVVRGAPVFALEKI